MIGKGLIILVAIFVTEQVTAIHVADVSYEGNRLMKTSKTNFIVAGKDLMESRQWQAVVRNDNELIFVYPGCKLEVGAIHQVYLDEYSPVLRIKSTLEKIARPTGKQLAGIVYKDGEEPHKNKADEEAKFYKINGNEIMVRSEDEFSVKNDHMLFEFERVFYQGDMVTILFNDGRLEMSELKCMPKKMRKYLAQLKEEIKGALAGESKDAVAKVAQ